MDKTRYTVKSPTESVHEEVRSLAQESSYVVLENKRRRSLSIEHPDDKLIEQLRERGATVDVEHRYDID